MLSRNFRLQSVGDIRWLQANYNFANISFFIDELIVLDVTRGEKDLAAFCDTLKQLTEGCFIPIAAGGGIRSVVHARQLLRSGADKVVVNTPIFEQTDLVKQLAEEFGQQCVVGSLDLQRSSDSDNQYHVWVDSGSKCLQGNARRWLQGLSDSSIGELYLNSINRDGTGQGFDFTILEQLPPNLVLPVIIAGGAGKADHLLQGLLDQKVDAVATAHLFNFVGDGLINARKAVLDAGIDLAVWDPDKIHELYKCMA